MRAYLSAPTLDHRRWHCQVRGGLENLPCCGKNPPVKLRRALTSITPFLVFSLMGCAPEGAALWESKTQTIVGGEDESGYPEVGSLFFQEWLQSQSKCTATLIKPDWILTAAHCLKDGLANLSFSIGSDAKDGTKFALADYVLHPRWDNNPIGSLYDIALVRLSEPVPANVATPRLYNRQPLEPHLGEIALYIGYGTTSGTSPFLGVGRKRRVELPIERVDLVTYSHGFDGSGLCFGDSGGPGLLQVDGELQIVGVNSAALGCQGDSCDPCTNGSKQTRVDRFADWIASHVGDSFTPCADAPGRCLCAAACGDDGICDNALCGAATCGAITDCLFDVCADSPDGACSTGCIDDGSIAARALLRLLVDCWAQECRGILGSANERQCLLDNCGSEWSACDEQEAPPGPDAGPGPSAEPDAGAIDPTGPDAGAGPGAADPESGGGCQLSTTLRGEPSIVLLGLLLLGLRGRSRRARSRRSELPRPQGASSSNAR